MTEPKPRMTRQRETILRVLRESGRALSAEEIWEQSRAIIPSLALTTVYRNLDRLLDNHQIQSVFLIDSGAVRYVMAKGHKHRIVCMGCDRTVDLENCPLETVKAQLEEETGFTVSAHNLELYGYCTACRNRMETEAKTKETP